MRTTALLACAVVATATTAASAAAAPTNLRVEGLAPEVAVISEPLPRFSFVHADAQAVRGTRQRSYRITVREATYATDAAAAVPTAPLLLWDSGDVVSANCSEIEYNGAALQPFSRYEWTAAWTDAITGQTSAAATAFFETGPIGLGDWAANGGADAKWLTDPDPSTNGPTQFRLEFNLPEAPVWARAYVAAPGCHHLELNGRVPAPDLRGICPWAVYPTNPKVRLRYMSHDVTAAATQGKNAVGIVGGNVMYSGSPEVLAVLVFRYASGAAPTIITSGTSGWSSKKRRGSSKTVYVTAASAWATTIDWTQHDPSWSTPAYNTTGAEWAPVNASALALATVAPRALAMPLSAVLGEVRPVKVENLGSLGFLYTFPKNFVGTVRVSPLPGAATGATLDVLAGEWLVNATLPPPSTMPTRCQMVKEKDEAYLGGCDAGHTISAVDFAAFGTPTGTCDTALAHDPTCDAPNASAVVEAACLGKPVCTVTASVSEFGGKDPCLDVVKRLYARVRCDNDAPTPAPVPTPAPAPTPPYIPQISGSRQQHETHVLRAGNTAPLETLFCWHGFQYVLVHSTGTTGFQGGLDDIVGLEIHTNLSTTGRVAFGGGGGPNGQQSALLNGLFSMTRASQLTNVAAYMPTDCPTREKHGWLGDALDASEQALYGFDMLAVHEAFLQTVEDNQFAGGDVPNVVPGGLNKGDSCNDIAWTAAYPQIANLLHRYYGDTRAIRRRWASLRSYTDNLIAHDQPLGVAACDRFQDWLCGNKQSCCTNSPAGSTCPVPQMMGAFNFVLTLRAMAEMAGAIGEAADAATYAGLAANATTAFHAAFWSDALGAYGGDQGATQSLTVPPLLIGSAPSAAEADKVVAALDANVAAPGVGQPPYTLRVGAVTSKVLLDVLSSHGRHDSALRLATQTAEPSWGYWWVNNATTCWENWPGNSGAPVPTGWVHGDSAGTRNHIFLCGGLVEWYWKHLVGLTPTSPAFATVRVAPKARPYLGPTEVNATYDSVRGAVAVSWSLAEQGKRVALAVTLPVGVQSATVAVPKPWASPTPAGRAARAMVTEGGTVVWDGAKLVGGVPGIVAARETVDGVEFDVTNGRFAFVATVAAGWRQ